MTQSGELTLTTFIPPIEAWSLLLSTAHVKPLSSSSSSSLFRRRRNMDDNTLLLNTSRHRARRMHINKQQQRILISSDEETIIAIEQIALDDTKSLECMSKFCIEEFYNNNNNYSTKAEAGTLSKIWKEIKLQTLQTLQLLEIFLSSHNSEFDRCIFVAKALTPTTLSSESYHQEIVGCCEVIEERFDILLPQQQQQQSSPELGNTSKRERSRRNNKNARHRPIIENLCVKRDYQRMGIGVALIHACEDVVQNYWSSSDHNAIYTQVDECNTNAQTIFYKLGYQPLFSDPTCTNIVLDDLFVKEVTVTKCMMRKAIYHNKDG